MDKSIPFFDLPESEQQKINDNIDNYLPRLPSSLGDRRMIERDIIGSMLINGSIKTKTILTTNDFVYARLRGLYRHLINNSDEHGSFDPMEVLTDDIDKNKYILNLMNETVNANINLKSRSIAR